MDSIKHPKTPRLIADVSDSDLERVKEFSKSLGLSVASLTRLAVFEKMQKGAQPA